MSLASIARYRAQALLAAVKWIEVNKCDEARPEYWSPLGGPETEKCGTPRFLERSAATPPIECLKVVLSNCMTEPVVQYKDSARKVEQFEEQQVQKEDDRMILVLEVPRSIFLRRNDPHRAPRRGQDRWRR